MRFNFQVFIITFLMTGLFNAYAGVTCANPFAGYNVSSTSANNVPVGQCYLNTVGECLYNTANPAITTGAWNTGCPSSVAGSDCCRWKGSSTVVVPQSGECCKAKPNANPAYDCSKPELNTSNPISYAYNRCVGVNAGVSCQWNTSSPKCCAEGVPGCNVNSCPPPAVSVSYPFQQLATNPDYAELYKRCKEEAGRSGNPEKYKCCVTPPKDPCKERGLQTVNAAAMNMQGGVLCCNSAEPKEEMMSGKKVCCEFVKSQRK